jgi:hypothetical protein
MKDLKIEATYKTPLVELNRNGKMLLSGRSIPENGFIFYQPIFSWIAEYCTRPVTKTILDANFEYINTVSSKCILDILKGFEKIKKNGNEVVVNWHYKEEETDILQAGQDYESILNMNFSFIAEK